MDMYKKQTEKNRQYFKDLKLIVKSMGSICHTVGEIATASLFWMTL